MDEAIAKILEQQQEAFQRQQIQMEQQQKLMERFMSIAASSSTSTDTLPSSSDSVMVMLSKNIKEFSYNSESTQTFEAWFSRYEHLFGEDAEKLNDSEKVRLILRKLDADVFDKYADYILPKVPRELDFKTTVATLKTIFGRKESLFSSRMNCLQYTKSSSIDYVTYGAIVNRNCDNFEFGKLKENHFKCLMFLRGLQSSDDIEIRARLLNFLEGDKEGSFTIDKMVTEVHHMLNLKRDAAVVEQSSVNAVNSVDHKSKVRENYKNKVPNEKPKRPCWQCGEMHFVKNCRYTNHMCEQCKVVGHKEGYCSCFSSQRTHSSFKKGKKKRGRNSQANLNALSSIAANRKHITVAINGVKQKLQFDTGADITIISKTVWSNINKPRLTKPTQTARDASGHVLELVGQCEAEVTFKEKHVIATLFVSQHKHLNVMGTDVMEQLGIWTLPIESICNNINTTEIGHIKSKFPKVFTNQPGHCFKFKVSLKLKNDIKPVFKSKRPVAYAALQQVDDELHRLEQANIITPVSYSRWAAPIVVVKKANGKVRICGDYSTGLNECMESHTYPLPLPDDIFVNFNNCKFFTRIDLTDAYLQFEVDDATKEILTINTHKGLFTFNRLAPGVKSAPGAFQQAMETILSGVQYAYPYLDDVIIATSSIEQNKIAVNEVFSRFEKYNLTVNFEKCSFFSRTCTYLGYKVDGNGIRPDPGKISSILKMPAPTNLSELRSFLGAVNYYGKFIRKMRQLRAPLDDLLKRDCEWQWNKACQEAFEKFKQILSSDLMLTHYNPLLPIKVAADASNVGIGAYICHQYPDGSEKAIYHVSRSLTQAERNYSQIEKEGLALVFAVKRFHKLLYGRRFKLETDHKPLLAIFGSKKGIPPHTASRLQRWALTLISYDFDLTYVPTDEFGCADILSRLVNKKQEPEEDVVIACAKLEASIKQLMHQNIDAFPITYKMVHVATQKDVLLQNVIKYLKNFWPKVMSQEENIFYHRKDSLCIVDGCLLYQDRIVIPTSLRQRVLKQLHKGHQGIVRTKSLARSYVYWPNIDKDVEKLIKECATCASTAKSPLRTTLQPWPNAQKPMERIHVDLAGPVDQRTYLLVVDSYSKWPEVFQLKSTTSASVIECLDDFFSHFGWPITLVSDNGTQFTSQDFSNFCRTRGIEHIFTAPFHPQSNGQVERFVDTFKRTLKKQTSPNTMSAVREFLMYYRAACNNSTHKSPSELFLGRKLRINMDILLKPKEVVSQQNDKMAMQYNRKYNAKNRKFKIGDEVYAKIYKHNKYFWAPGIIKNVLGKVNYEVGIKTFPYFKSMRSHANQLRTRHSEPLNVNSWLDIFDLNPPPTSPPHHQNDDNDCPSTSSQEATPSTTATQPKSDDINNQQQEETQEGLEPTVRRSQRNRREPNWFRDYTT